MARHWQWPVVVTGILRAAEPLAAGAFLATERAGAALAAATLAFADMAIPGVWTNELAHSLPAVKPLAPAADLVTGPHVIGQALAPIAAQTSRSNQGNSLRFNLSSDTGRVRSLPSSRP